MLSRMSLLAGLVLLASLAPLTTHAQDKVEFFGGYSYMRLDASPSADPSISSFNMNGWEISGQYKFRDWLGAVGDFDGHYASPAGEHTSVETFLFGPQVSWPTRVSPFAHLLAGGAHISTGPFSGNSLSAALGAGIDYRVREHIYWRVIQGDYLLTRFFGNTQNNARLSTGIVFKF